MNTLFFHGRKEIEAFQGGRKGSADPVRPGLYLIRLRSHLGGGRKALEKLLDTVEKALPVIPVLPPPPGLLAERNPSEPNPEILDTLLPQTKVEPPTS